MRIVMDSMKPSEWHLVATTTIVKYPADDVYTLCGKEFTIGQAELGDYNFYIKYLNYCVLCTNAYLERLSEQ